MTALLVLPSCTPATGTPHPVAAGRAGARLILTFSPAGIEKFVEETLERADDPTRTPPDNIDQVAARQAEAGPATGCNSSPEPDSMSGPDLLAMVATVYGVGAAGAALLQARQILRRGSSCEVSARFFATYAGGYAIWLLYGVSIASLPLVLVDAIGLLCGLATLAVTLALRGSLALAPAPGAAAPTAPRRERRRAVRGPASSCESLAA